MTDADERSTMALENDIERTRADMDDTIDALKRKFSPEEMVDQAADYMRNHTGDIMMNFGQTLKENPVPLALVGLGIGWLLISGKSDSSRHSASSSDDDAYESYYEGYSQASQKAHPSSMTATAAKKASAAYEGISDKVAEAVDEISAKTSAAVDGLSARASSTMDDLSDRAGQAYDATRATAQQHPLVLGAIGLAVGIAAAMLLPRTRQEDASIGEMRDRMVEQVKEAGKETLQKAKDVASDAWDAAKQTVTDEVMPDKDDKSGGKTAHRQDSAPGSAQDASTSRAGDKTGADRSSNAGSASASRSSYQGNTSSFAQDNPKSAASDKTGGDKTGGDKTGSDKTGGGKSGSGPYQGGKPSLTS